MGSMTAADLRPWARVLVEGGAAAWRRWVVVLERLAIVFLRGPVGRDTCGDPAGVMG